MLGHACLGHNSVFLELYTRQNVGSQLSMHTFGPDGGYCLCVLRVKGVTTMGVATAKFEVLMYESDRLQSSRD